MMVKLSSPNSQRTLNKSFLFCVLVFHFIYWLVKLLKFRWYQERIIINKMPVTKIQTVAQCNQRVPCVSEYKRARSELKKRSTDTLRLQKKARKGKSGELQRRVECSLLDVNERRQILEDTEKASVRAALVEERSRFCLFVAFMKPVVDEEVAMLSELSHLQEVSWKPS